MELIRWSYTRRYNIKATFHQFPHSNVIFRKINQYYFVYIVNWSQLDPVVLREDLEKMEWILNEELGCEQHYRKRYARQKINNHVDGVLKGD